MYKLICCCLFLGIYLEVYTQQTELERDISLIEDYNESIHKLENEIFRISDNFAFYNECCPTKADLLLDKINEVSRYTEFKYSNFLLKNSSVLTESQYLKIRQHLMSFVKESNPLYLELVSRFQLTQFAPEIQEKILPEALDISFNQFEEKGYIKSSSVIQLTYRTTLANLGRNTHESDLIDYVTQLYDRIKINKKNKVNQNLVNKQLGNLFNVIIPNTIGKLHSKNSVESTLFLMDEDDKEIGSYDYGPQLYAYNYFIHAVVPKLKSMDGMLLNPEYFYKHRSTVKLIIEDSNSWQDFIK